MSYIEHIRRTHTISTQNAYYIFKQGHYTTEGIWSCLCQRGIRMLRSFTVSVLLSLRSHKEGLYGPVTHPPPSVRVYEPFIPTQWVFMNLHSHIVGHWTLHSKRVDLWSLHSHTAGLWLYTPTESSCSPLVLSQKFLLLYCLCVQDLPLRCLSCFPYLFQWLQKWKLRTSKYQNCQNQRPEYCRRYICNE